MKLVNKTKKLINKPFHRSASFETDTTHEKAQQGHILRVFPVVSIT